MNLIDALNWRSATKVFDQTKKVSEEDIEMLIEVGNLAPTSAGLQPFKLIMIKDQDLKDRLSAASYGQIQVSQASHLMIFATHQISGQQMVDDYIDRVAEVRNQDPNSLVGMKQSFSAYVNAMDANTIQHWAGKQAYISMGTVMSAAAQMKIDICPLEGFDPVQFRQILNLDEENLIPVAFLAIGYRSEEDMISRLPKVRKKREDLVVEINE